MSESLKDIKSYFDESWPIGLLQSCPRCGNETYNYLTPNESLWLDDFTAGCYRCNHSEKRERWNLRPVEHKLEQQIAQLTKERDELKVQLEGLKANYNTQNEWLIEWKRVAEALKESQPCILHLVHRIEKAERDSDELRDLVDKANSVGYGTAFTLQIERIQKERDQLAANCSAKDAVLQSIIDGAVHPDKAVRRVLVDLDPIRHALSDQCGVGWLSPEKKKVLVDQVTKMPCECNRLALFVCQRCKALEAAQ